MISQRKRKERKMSVEDKITEKVRDVFGLDEGVEVTPQTDLTSLGADSLDIAELVMEVEEEFDITLPDEEVSKYQTVEAIAEYVRNNQ